MGSPTIFAGKRTKFLSAKGGLLASGETIDFDGPINYITNNNAEINATGWATYANAAGTTPVNGTGGSPTITYARSTSSPLRGDASFLLTKGASNLQGQGFSYDFTIDTADQGNFINVAFDYFVSSGTYASSDLGFFIYDKTNAVLVATGTVGLPGGSTQLHFTSGFKAATNSTSYRFIIHIASTSAIAYSLQFDNYFCGPAGLLTGSASVIAAKTKLSVDTAVTINTPIPFDTVIYDTNPGSMGVTGVYQPPVPGKYLVHGAMLFNATGNLRVFLAGSVSDFLAGNGAGSGTNFGFAMEVNITGALETIDVRPDASLNIIAANSRLCITYLSGSSGSSSGGVARSINSISSPTTAAAAAATDYVYFVSGTTTLTLPTAVGNTNQYTVKNTGVATVTVATTSSQTIDGSSTASLPVANTSLNLISDNANWRIV